MKKILLQSRSALLVFLTHKVALPLLKMIRKPAAFSYSADELRLFPAESLGHELYLFLEKRNLPLLKHYARHDMKHVLLEYDTTEAGEACLQCFMLGNGRISFPVLATVLYSFICMPEHWEKMKTAFRKGRSCVPFHHWKWNELVKEPTTALRNKIFNHF